MHDVIVVGAGPAGLYAALCLAREGLDVLVVEEHHAIGLPTHCTGVVSVEIEEFYKVPDSAILHRPRVCRMVSPSERTYEFPANGEEILVIDRAAFDQSLHFQARQAGVEVRCGCRVVGLTSGAGGVETAMEDGAPVRARLAILASGVAYRIQRRLGWGLPSHFLHSAQLEVDAQETHAVELYFGRSAAPEGFGWLAPVSRGDRWRAKVGVVTSGDAGRRLEHILRRPSIARRLTGVPDEPVRRLMPLAPLPKTFGDRVLAVGDAAGLTKPTTGGGIFYCVLSGSLAAETIVDAFRRGRFGEEQLAPYETRWRTRLGAELRTAARFRAVLSRLSDREIDTVLEAIAATEVHDAIHRMARFNWHRNVILSILRLPGIRSLLRS